MLNLRSLGLYGLLLCCLTLQGCGIYSFSGISTTAKTIYIGNFFNQAAAGPANLGQQFTEDLKGYFLQNSRLQLVNSPGDADLTLEGMVVGYTAMPQGVTANDAGAVNRLTITVDVDFKNMIEEDKDFRRQFSFYQDFPQNQDLSTVEVRLISQIFEQINLDIFNATLADW
ncbi:LptE family protein [Eisenibacter elegans]|jgi:hypothetical protein|uniref:LptE family protein n=1 Tax=Eisenibacter elegans TaxID=997 RepID=UPI000429867A|nr:LptE family protein [Eisenibacter elegans]